MGAVSTGTLSPSVTTCDPDELRRAARLLLGVSQEVHQLAGRTQSAATVDGWLGVAALEQQGRAAGLGALVESTIRPQEEVAGALDRCADVAETCAGRVRLWTRRAAELGAEQSRLRTMGPPPDPLLERAWRRRLEEIDAELARARRLVDEAEEAFDAAQRQAASVVSGAWSAVRELADLGQVLKDLGKLPGLLLKFPRRVVWTSAMLVALAQARWARAAPVRALARQRLDVLLSRLRGLLRTTPHKRTWVTKLRGVPGPIGMVLAWFTAWTDVRTGGGLSIIHI